MFKGIDLDLYAFYPPTHRNQAVCTHMHIHSHTLYLASQVVHICLTNRVIEDFSKKAKNVMKD